MSYSPNVKEEIVKLPQSLTILWSSSTLLNLLDLATTYFQILAEVPSTGFPRVSMPHVLNRINEMFGLYQNVKLSLESVLEM